MHRFIALALSLVGFALFSCAGAQRRVPVYSGPVPVAKPSATAYGASADTLSVNSAAPLSASSGYDARLTHYPYPFDVHFFDFKSQGQPLQLAYMDESGANTRGETVLLLHGKNFTSAYWERTIRALVSRGYRVIAVDQIGFGKSSKPVRFQFSFAEMAEETHALLDFLRLTRVNVVGHSMGGMLAVRFARMFPERTERLVLVNPLGLEDWQQVVPYQSISELYHQELAKTPLDLKSYMQANYFGGTWAPAYDELLDVPSGWLKGPDRRLIAWENALTSDMIFTQPIVQELSQLEMPTLLIIGQRDRTALGRDRVAPGVATSLGDYPALGKRAAAAIPHSTLRAIPAAGHLPQVDAFDEYVRALEEFLPHY